MTARVVKREGILPTIREKRSKAKIAWSHFPALRKFLADHYPEQWSAVQGCRHNYKTYESRARPGHYKLLPYSCHRLPFCIHCVDRERSRRIMLALDRFHRCAPKGYEPIYIHIVQTAPIYDDGGGWGNEASRNISKFGEIVWRALKDAYGDGIGAHMSYQDFGERAFAKRHPHLDLTLNGWRLMDGRAEKTPRYELGNGGRNRWNQNVVRYARSLRIDADIGSVDIHSPTVGYRAYYGAMKYQVRELVDFRKIGDYFPSRQELYWHSKDNHREKLTVAQFKAGLEEYQARLGLWSHGQARNLHRAYGHMSDRTVNKTEDLVGGSSIPHGKNCPCSECGDWDRVFLDEVEEAAVRTGRTFMA